MEIRKKVFALDLKDDPQLIKEYIEYHKNVWPEVVKTFEDSGIKSMEIFNVFDRLFMIIEVTDEYGNASDRLSEKQLRKLEEWEELMWKFQKALPGVEKGQKWVEMERIFQYP